MPSIIIPAHNEEQVIERTVTTLLRGTAREEFEVVVVCNGCRDKTAAVLRRIQGIKVIETAVPSKPNALNLGDAAATCFPRIYMDADVLMDAASVRELTRVLQAGDYPAVAPRVHTLFPANSSWTVRKYYEFWMALPYVKEGMVAAGVYALSDKGRARFGIFPDIIADDGFVRSHFSRDERLEVATAVSQVTAPSNVRDLIRIKTRSRLGEIELRQRFPNLNDPSTQPISRYGKIASLLNAPILWPGLPPYFVITLISRLRARHQLRSTSTYQWERDESSRQSLTPTGTLPAVNGNDARKAR